MQVPPGFPSLMDGYQRAYKDAGRKEIIIILRTWHEFSFIELGTGIFRTKIYLFATKFFRCPLGLLCSYVKTSPFLWALGKNRPPPSALRPGGKSTGHYRW